MSKDDRDAARHLEAKARRLTAAGNEVEYRHGCDEIFSNFGSFTTTAATPTAEPGAHRFVSLSNDQEIPPSSTASRQLDCR